LTEIASEDPHNLGE